MPAAGYDVSASRSEATSQAANQQAGTVFNFGNGNAGDVYASQAANPAATAVAARTAGNTAGGIDATLPGGTIPFHHTVDWPMVAIAIVAIAAIAAAVHYHKSP